MIKANVIKPPLEQVIMCHDSQACDSSIYDSESNRRQKMRYIHFARQASLALNVRSIIAEYGRMSHHIEMFFTVFLVLFFIFIFWLFIVGCSGVVRKLCEKRRMEIGNFKKEIFHTRNQIVRLLFYLFSP